MSDSGGIRQGKSNETHSYDRDVNGSVNIGLLWISDNIKGRSRPKVFVRPEKEKKAAKFTKSLPAQNSG